MSTVRYIQTLPGGKVPVPEDSETKRYYKYYQQPFEDLSEERKAEIRAKRGRMEDAVEFKDRNKVLDSKAWPAETGLYPLEGGGMLVCSNVKIPNITGEMMNWWGPWHCLDPLRYALWDQEDHYNVQINAEARARILNPDVPVAEKLWGMTHNILESMDGERPDPVVLTFMNPAEAGYDVSKIGEGCCLICGKSMLNGVPGFLTEYTCKGEDGVWEVRFRNWLGYALDENGNGVCMIPPNVEIPVDVVSSLMVHNFREFERLNKILPSIYAEEKDNW